MRCEFDAAKSAANRLKHGIDFVKAQALTTAKERSLLFIAFKSSGSDDAALEPILPNVKMIA